MASFDGLTTPSGCSLSRNQSTPCPTARLEFHGKDYSISITLLTRFDGVRVPTSDYLPVWLNSLADDVTLEGSAMNGVEAVRSIVTYIRTLYDAQEFHFAGPYGEDGFLEDYTAHVRGQQLDNVVLVTRNAAGQAQHIAANYRPRTTLLLVSRLVGEHFADTPRTASTSRPAPSSEGSMG